MPEYVRIKDPATGHHLTVTTEEFVAFGGELLKSPAVDALGRPLPPKYHTDITTKRAAGPDKE